MFSTYSITNLNYLGYDKYLNKKNLKKQKVFLNKYENERFFFSVLYSIFNMKQISYMKKTKYEKKKIAREMESDIFHHLNQKIFFYFENASNFFSYFVCLMKMGMKKKIKKILSILLFKKSGVLNFWQFLFFLEWQSSSSFRGIRKIFCFALKTLKVILNLYKDYFRFKIFYLKKKIAYFNSSVNEKITKVPWWNRMVFILFSNFLIKDLSKNVCCHIIQILGKETWSFPSFGKNFIRISHLIRSLLSEKRAFLKILFFLPIPFFFSKSRRTNKAIRNMEFYLQILNKNFLNHFCILRKNFFFYQKEKKKPNWKKKKNFSQYINISYFFQ